MLNLAAGLVAGAALVIHSSTVDPEIPRWRILYEAARRLHPLWEGRGRYPLAERDEWKRLVRPRAGSSESPVSLVLPAETWARVVFARPVPQADVAEAILGERAASLLYRGLFQLDPATLAFVEYHPEMLRALHERAEPFAVFARSIRVRAGRVDVPGGALAEPLWEDLAGETVGRPERFLPALLSKSEGRLALFLDSISRLGPEAQRFALDLAQPDARLRLERFNALRESFRREELWWRPDLGAFRRPLVDPERVLTEIAVDASGRMAPPSRRSFWESVFGESRGAAGESMPEAAAAWVVKNVASGPARVRRERLTQIVFAQRVFGDAPDAALGEVASAVRGLAENPALVLTLDRMGVRDPTLYASAVRAADRLAALPDASRRAEALAQFQGTLAALDRARSWALTLDAETTGALLKSLFAAVLGEQGYRGALAAWWQAELLPALRRSVSDEGIPGTSERVLMRALSGLRRDAAPPRAFEWEGLWYHSDPGLAELRHLESVRRKQGGPSLDEALASPLRRGDALLAEALTSIAYAPHLGPVDGPALAGSNVARRHSFGDAPWALPTEVAGAGIPWHVEGSLLGLDVALARLGLKRVAGAEMPAHAPGLDERALAHYARTASLMSPFAVRDEDLGTIADALRRGHARVARLATGEDVDEVARDAGLEAWRREGLRWAIVHEPEALERFFSLAEVLALGRPEPALSAVWGTPDLAFGGSLRLRLPPRSFDDHLGRRSEDLMPAHFPDLALRVAADLEERSLPASLAPALLGRLVRDFVDLSPSMDYDDHLPLARYPRELSPERVDDFIASLADEGPLVATPGPEAQAP